MVGAALPEPQGDVKVGVACRTKASAAQAPAARVLYGRLGATGCCFNGSALPLLSLVLLLLLLLCAGVSEQLHAGQSVANRLPLGSRSCAEERLRTRD